ncbi:MAG: STAS domain-containing protein [Planctomycetota bacterium]
MAISVSKHGAVTVLTPDGPLVSDVAADFAAELRSATRETLGRVAVNCTSMTHVDSAGLESLVIAAEKLEESGQALKLCNVNSTVREVIDLTGTAGFFECFADINSAVRSFL